MVSYKIKVVECTSFDYTIFSRTVVATADEHNPNLLWYTSVYGLDCVAYLDKHPEAEIILKGGETNA